MKKYFWVMAAIMVGLVAGVAGYFYSSPSSSEEIHPHRGEIVEAIYGLGKVKSRRQYEVKIGVLDTAQEVFVKEGDLVERGQALIRFSDSAIMRAPFKGTVTMVSADPGETVSPQVPVVRLEDLRDKYIEVSIEQHGALRVSEKQEAKVLFESLRGEELKGQVMALFPRNDEFLAHISVEGLKENVLPGMTADVAIVVGRREQALLVPLRAVVNGQVIRRRQGKNEKIGVKIGNVDGQWAEIAEGDVTTEDFIIVKRTK